MNHISIRDLQRISGETIAALDGPTPIKSGERTVGIIVPLKTADQKKLRRTLLRAEELARGRDVAADDAALEAYGPVDKIDWSFAAAGRRSKPKTRKGK